MSKPIPYKFDIQFDTKLIPTSDPDLFQSKVRVFYKNLNRNGSYITNEYAEKLAVSAYAKPIVGTYDHMVKDFKGHERAETQKGYGFVIPGSLTWEDHLDDDGIVRNYATYDVILWAEYWDEAKIIPEKTQSMEIDPKTIKGSWMFMEDCEEEAYVYTEGVMAGLCVLGDSKTPCFEGAAFFSMEDEGYKKFSTAIKNLYGGKVKMNVKINGYEHSNYETIWNALNPQFNEEGAYSIDEVPMQYDEENKVLHTYVCSAPGTICEYNCFEDEEGALNLVEVRTVNCFSLTTELEAQTSLVAEKQNEIAALEANFATATEDANTLKEQIAALQASFAALQEQFEALTISNTELQSNYDNEVSKNAELTTSCETLNNELTEVKTKAETLENENFSLSENLKKFEKAEKNRLIATFSKSLSDEAMKPITDRQDELTYDEMKSLLSIEYATFSLQQEEEEDTFRFPKTEEEEPKLYSILNKYKKS